MKFFAMTRDRLHLLTPALLGPVLLVALVVNPSRIGSVVLGAVVAMLGVVTLMAPRGVAVAFNELRMARLGWPSFRAPLSELTRIERGPDTRVKGSVLRLAGVGGWFWSGGLFRARGVGNVRAWLTRLGPTLVLHRRRGLPILLGVDDVEGLLKALALRGLRVR